MAVTPTDSDILAWVADQLRRDTPEGRHIRDLAAGKVVLVPRLEPATLKRQEGKSQ